MFASKTVASYPRLSGRRVAFAMAMTFAIGMIAGVAVRAAADGATDRNSAIARPFSGVAENNMSDAAYAAQHPSSSVGLFRGVAENNMSDAAYAAQHPSSSRQPARSAPEHNRAISRSRRSVSMRHRAGA